jgi:plastocyanin
VITTKHQRIGGLAAASLLAIALVPATAGAGGGAGPTATATAAAAAAKKPVKKKVQVADYYYGPARETIPKGSTLTWVWPDAGGDSHDVQFGTGPKGAKKFASEIATAGYTFKHTFKVAGKYHIICSLHDEMTMDVTVR